MSLDDRWHESMYDHEFASTTIGSSPLCKLAKKEAAFLISTLGLSPGDRILDVPCGAGRHSGEFARQGLRVTGVDINDACLKLARSACQGKKVKLIRGDMSELSRYRDKLDAVVNLFSSFGYFSSDAANERVLRGFVTSLKPGGRIAIHLINRDWLMKVFRSVDWHEENGRLVVEIREYDPCTHYIETRRVVLHPKGGRSTVSFHRMRLYSKHEMVQLMKLCGLEEVKVFGDFEGGSFSKFGSSHPIYVGSKRE